MKKKQFFPTETYDGRYMIGFYFEDFRLRDKDISFYFASSYNVVPARLLGFSYPDFLRYCEKNGATLKGKNGYTHAVWKEKNDCNRVCELINKEWEKVAAAFQFYMSNDKQEN